MAKDRQLARLLARAEKKLKRTTFRDLGVHSNENGENHYVTFTWVDNITHHSYRFHHHKTDSSDESLFFDVLDADGHLSFCGEEVDKKYLLFLNNIGSYLRRKITEEAEREKVSFGYLSRRARKLARFYNK